MQDEAPTPNLPETQEGVEEWLDLVDHALEGVHHALNNRIGSLSALVELYQLGELPPSGSGFDNGGRSARLTDCTASSDFSRATGRRARSFSTTSRRRWRSIATCTTPAIQVTIKADALRRPVRVERWALVRVLTLLGRAKRLAKAHATSVRVVTSRTNNGCG